MAVAAPWFETWLFRFGMSFMVLIGLIPKTALTTLARFLSLAIPLFKKEHKRIQQNVFRVMKLPAHSVFSKMFCRQVLRHQLMMMLETMKELLDPGSIHAEGLAEYEEHMTRALAQGKGVLVITGHIGSWELVARYGADAAHKNFFALAKPPKVSWALPLLTRLRLSGKTKILWTGSARILREMLETLHGNYPLGFVMDQKPETGFLFLLQNQKPDQRKGIAVDFLKQPTEFVAGPARIALKTGSPILGVYCLRLGPWHYRIECEPIAWQEALGPSPTEEAITALLAQSIEKKIEMYPEQWVWNYKRW